ncbi:MAG: hypothetical protein IJ719_19705 [Clostridia bacterium]|nr:hypothetical protein [Clostridia bacterium]
MRKDDHRGVMVQLLRQALDQCPENRPIRMCAGEKQSICGIGEEVLSWKDAACQMQVHDRMAKNIS